MSALSRVIDEMNFDAEAFIRAVGHAADDFALAFIHGHGDVCSEWARSRADRAEAEYHQQQAEIRAETNIPQHLVW